MANVLATILAPLGRLNPEQRAYAYRVLTALLALGVVYGIISDNEVGYILALAAAVLGLPAAVVNTNTHPDPG